MEGKNTLSASMLTQMDATPKKGRRSTKLKFTPASPNQQDINKEFG